MAKGSGGTRASSSSAPKGLSANEAAAQRVGYGSVNEEQYILDHFKKKKDLARQAQKSKWHVLGISKVTAEKKVFIDGPIKTVRVQLRTEKGENVFTAGIWKLSNLEKPGYTTAKQALYRRFDEKTFKSASAAMKFAEIEALKFNEKWGKK